jgi:hypothetical protein
MCKFLYFLSYHRPYCNTFPNSDCFEIFTQDKTVSLQILRTISPDPTVGLGDMIDTVKLDSWCLLRQNLNFML